MIRLRVDQSKQLLQSWFYFKGTSVGLDLYYDIYYHENSDQMDLAKTVGDGHPAKVFRISKSRRVGKLCNYCCSPRRKESFLGIIPPQETKEHTNE